MTPCIDGMKISPYFTDSDWLRLHFTDESDWQEAIKIFRDRIEGRFFIPIQRMVGYKFSGFAIIALDCLLVETIQQFKKGVYETPKGKGFEYFEEFLTKTGFKAYFDKKLAMKFYKQIRCGIIHQAETKNSSTIRKADSLPLVKLSDDGEGIVINRKKFHNQLESEFTKYLDELGKPFNRTLRENFKKKMDYICRKRG